MWQGTGIKGRGPEHMIVCCQAAMRLSARVEVAVSSPNHMQTRSTGRRLFYILPRIGNRAEKPICFFGGAFCFMSVLASLSEFCVLHHTASHCIASSPSERQSVSIDLSK